MLISEPEFKDRLGAAIFIIAVGAENTGVMTCQKLMWPYTEYEIGDVKRASARLVASVHTALLATLPPPQIELISKDLSSYLSFAVGDGWPDEKSPSQEDG